MKKKIFGAILSLFVIFTLSACGSSINSQKEVYGVKRDSIIESMEKTALQVNGLSVKEIKKYQEAFQQQADTATNDADKDSAEMYLSLFDNVLSHKDELGTFKGFETFKISKSGKTVTCTLRENFSKRECDFVYVYTVVNDGMKLTGMNLTPVYSLGETMSKAGWNVLMGMGIVFVVLIIISLIIYAFNVFPYIEKKMKEKNKAVENTEVKEPVSTETMDDELEDEELVAVIAAAVASFSGESTDSFVVRSIKKRY